MTRRRRVTFSFPMAELTLVKQGNEDRLWAVLAHLGKQTRVAEVYRSHAQALEDRDWRAREVRAYEDFLRRTRQEVPRYSVAPIRRSDLPRRWTPLPALGFLRGQWA
ncbi:hypothetical protein ACI6QG_09240 [Roseococcus sp. DSY-14]|uniref:hypothetical protein n=1 Tax=Roseococcus sp. DSY-14 TaxID=3369650 RepID=UPI00387B5C96